MDEVWPGVHVEENGLARSISVLPKALGGTDDELFIETCRGQGYRILAAVTTVPLGGRPVTSP
jgi:DNA-binding winged helix-turn-helix (wHTH) protein